MVVESIGVHLLAHYWLWQSVCIPPNKIPETTIVAITDIWNILVYMDMDINTTALHLWNKSQKMVGGGVVELLISEITRSVLDYPVPHKKYHSPPIEYHGIYYTNTISNEITGIYSPHKTTLYMTTRPLTYVTNDIQDLAKCCIKSWVY